MESPNPPVKLAAGERFGPVGGRAAFRLACSFSAASVFLSGAAVVFAALNAPEPILDVAWVAVVMAVPFPAVGALIVSRQPANAIGWIFCAIGLFQGVNIFAGQYGRYALLASPDSLPGGEAMIWLESWTWMPSLALLTTFLLLLFPDGRPPGRRWRWLAGLSAASLTLAVIPLAASAWSEGGMGILCAQREFEAARETLEALCPPGPARMEEGILIQIGSVGLAATGMCALGSVASLVARFRRSTGVERQQIKWFAFAGVVAFACIAAMFTPLDEYRSILALGILAIPVAVGMAVLRYRLYDIDVIINRALVYAALTAIVIGMYVLIVGYLGAVFRTGGNLAASLVAAGVVAVIFAPLRDRLQRTINRLMYGERDEPYAVISRLGQRLEAALEPRAVLPTVVSTVREALRLPYAAIELKGKDGFTVAAEDGEPIKGPLHLPLTYQNEPVGRLVLGPRAPGEDLSPADRNLLDDLARQAGVAAHAVRLTADLQRSRERLVTTREEERRRLRRDLHDGLGPQLAALNVHAGIVRGLIRRDPDSADELVVEMRREIQSAVADIRRLVHELRPPALDQLGLVPALRQLAARFGTGGKSSGGDALEVVVDAPDELPPLPAAVEVAVYRIVDEALTNVVRHARARNCAVRLGLAESDLRLEITDDGVGIPPMHTSGVGLVSMRERASELGGSCEIEPLPEGGTRVSVRIPMAKE
ncbi:MAG: sensor histidine kinase [Rubrobacteraceae bacterium]